MIGSIKAVLTCDKMRSNVSCAIAITPKKLSWILGPLRNGRNYTVSNCRNASQLLNSTPTHFNNRWQLGIETGRVLKNLGPGETRPFCQTRNPGLRAAETRVSGLFFSADFGPIEPGFGNSRSGLESLVTAYDGKFWKKRQILKSIFKNEFSWFRQTLWFDIRKWCHHAHNRAQL